MSPSKSNNQEAAIYFRYSREVACVNTCSNLHLRVHAIQSWSFPGNDRDTALDINNYTATVHNCPQSTAPQHVCGIPLIIVKGGERKIVSYTKFFRDFISHF